MNISNWLERTAQAHPDRPALFAGTEQVADYGGWWRQSLAVAGAMQAQAVGPGDRVGLFMKNTPEYLVALYAIWALGAVAVPINAKLHPKEAAWILEDAGAQLAFATPGLVSDLAHTSPVSVINTGGATWTDMRQSQPLSSVVPRAPGDLAWLFYTSGTTGRPKGVQITHRMLVTMSLAYQADCDLVRAEHAAIYAAPLSHGAGIYNMMHVQAGARHVCPVSGGFDTTEVLDLASVFTGAHLFMAPTMVQRLTKDAKAGARRGEGLRSIVYAGGPMYTADIIEAVDWFGPVFAQIYGQGECPMGITALSRFDVADRRHPNWRARLGSVGRAQSVSELRIADETGAALPAGQVGEILVRGDVVMPGYWQNPQATASALREGWLWTGDMGAMDEEGYVTLKDRSKDMIISGGTNIYPREVEEVLLTHPSVQEAAVIGRPHEEWGEEVVAFVVCRDGLDPKALDAHCLAQMARFKRPKAYFASQTLPKNNYGKVLKTALRDKLADSASAGRDGCAGAVDKAMA